MAETHYPHQPRDDYFCYVIDEEVTLGRLDINTLISKERIQNHDYQDGASIFK